MINSKIVTPTAENENLPYPYLARGIGTHIDACSVDVGTILLVVGYRKAICLKTNDKEWEVGEVCSYLNMNLIKPLAPGEDLILSNG